MSAAPEYGQKLGDYTVDELRHLLKKEETRLSTLKMHMQTKKSEKEGTTLDDMGGVVRVFSDEEKTKIKEVFDRVDTDGSGYLDIEELGKVIFGLGVRLGGVELLQAHKELDANGDGRVSFEEFLDWWGSDVSRGRYKGTALAQLKGRLVTDRKGNAGEKLRKTVKEFNERKVKLDTSLDIGDCGKPLTKLCADVKPGDARVFQRRVDEVVDLDNLTEWLANPYSIAADLWLGYKAHKQHSVIYADARFAIAPEKRSTVEKIIDLFKQEHLKQLARHIADEGIPSEGQEAFEVLQKAGISKEGDEEREYWDNEQTKNFRKHCTILGKSMNIERGETGTETAERGSALPEGSDEAILLQNLQFVCDIDEAYDMMPVIKFDVTETELIVTTLLFVDKAVEEDLRQKLESVVNQDLESYLRECVDFFSLSVGLSGDFGAHIREVVEKDGSVLDMIGWGLSSRFAASYSPKLVEAALASNQQIENIMIPSVASGILTQMRTKLRVRNPFAKASDIIDYLILDAQSSFAGHSGLNEHGEGYTWGKEGEQQLEEVRKWAHFLLKSAHEKLRLGNPSLKPAISHLTKKMKVVLSESPADGEEIGGWERMQDLKKCVGALKGANVLSPYLCAEVKIEGTMGLLDPIPSDQVLKDISNGSRKSGEDTKHAEECKKRAETLGLDKEYDSDGDGYDDSAYDEKFAALKDAIEHIETIKGGPAMASKDGILFVTLVVQLLKKRSFPGSGGQKMFQLLLGTLKMKDESADADEDSSHGSEALVGGEGMTHKFLRKASSMRLRRNG